MLSFETHNSIICVDEPPNIGLDETLNRIQKQIIMDAFHSKYGRVSTAQVARFLGIERTTLLFRMKKLGLQKYGGEIAL